jgi:hypothetical protein
MEVHGAKQQVFEGELAYIPHEISFPHLLDPRFEKCNIIGVDWLRMSEAHLNLHFPGPMTLTVPPLGCNGNISAVEE